MWIGGKSGDNFKGLPIDIVSGSRDSIAVRSADADEQKFTLYGGDKSQKVCDAGRVTAGVLPDGG